MKIDVQHIQKRGKAGWRYRRKIPEALRAILGKREILVPLGSTEAEAFKKWPKVHAAAEKELREATARKAGTLSVRVPMSALDQFKHGQKAIRELQLDPEWAGEGEDHDDEVVARDVIAEHIVAKYPVDEHGHPIGVGTSDAAVLQALAYGARQGRPEPTVKDARRQYEKDKVGDDEKKQKQVARIFGLVADALGRDRTLRGLRREDAREVRDHMLDTGLAASSVDRYLNIVRAAFDHAVREFDLTGLLNPFAKLEAAPRDKAEPDRDKRRPFTAEELAAVNSRIDLLARPDLRRIWRMLEGTGCRLAEVAGLRVSDVHAEDAIPHIVVEWHDDRRIKNKVSRRKVPLIGDALAAAKEALGAVKGEAMLFPAYGRKKGASSASAALGQHVRACVSDPKVVTHSLRHLMKDRLRHAGVSKTDQDIVLGHSSGSVGEDYGGDQVRLEVAKRALEKALNMA
jgi:integrase